MRYYIYVYNKIAFVGAMFGNLKCKLCTDAAAEGFLVAELWQIKIGETSCFATS